MSDFLFDVPEQKSPRLMWLEKHGIYTRSVKGESDELGDHKAWIAGIGDGVNRGFEVGYGDSEDEAITNLALNLGIRLWNEEGGQP